MRYGSNSFKNRRSSEIELFVGFKSEDEGRGKTIGVELRTIESGDTKQQMSVILEGHEVRALAEELLDRAVQLEALHTGLAMNHEERKAKLKEFPVQGWSEESRWVVKPKKDLIG